MKTIKYSLVSCLVICPIAYLIGGVKLILQVNFGIGLVLLLAGAVFSGSLLSGDQIRANFNASTKKDRERRNKWIDKLVIIAVPFIIVAVFIFTTRYMIK